MALIHAPVRSTRLTGWLSRDGGAIVLDLLGTTAPLRFQGPEGEPPESSQWGPLDRILRSTGK